MTRRGAATALSVIPLLAALALAEAGPSAPRTTIARLDPRLDKLVPGDAHLERLQDGFDWLEGPAWSPALGSLLFSDIPRNAVYRWSPGSRVELFLQPSGYTGPSPFAGREPGSNGLLFDSEGRLILCEHGDRRITRLEADGRKTVLVDRYRGRRLNSPNDAVLSAAGDLFFTDPPFGLPGTFEDPKRELDFSGVYRLAPTGVLTLLTAAIRAPNGIALSPDETLLYVTDVDPARPAWLVYPLRPDGTLGPGRVFVDALPFTLVHAGGPDGLKLDDAGNLFAAGPGGVYVFAPDGTHLGTLSTGVATSNVAWGEDGSTLFVTAGSALYRIRLTTRGAGWRPS